MEKVILAKDGCAVTAETVQGRFPVEPLNTVSNLLLLFILIYWMRKVKFRFEVHPLIVTVIPVLFTGVFASIMFHAFRDTRIWNTIDMISIFYAVIMASIYLWYRVTGSWLYSALITLMLPLMLRLFFASVYIPAKMTSSVIFAAMSVLLLLPSVVLSLQNAMRYVDKLALSAFLFTVAMIFREIDMPSKVVFSHGTHFLWHLFAAGAVFFFMQYIYLSDLTRTSHKKALG